MPQGQVHVGVGGWNKPNRPAWTAAHQNLKISTWDAFPMVDNLIKPILEITRNKLRAD